MISLIGIPIVAIGGYFLVYILAIGNKESFGVGLIGSITFQNLVFAVLMMLDITDYKQRIPTREKTKL